MRWRWAVPPAVVLAAWSLASYVAGVSNALLPSPDAVVSRLGSALVDGSMASDALATIRVGVVGLFIGFVPAWALGILSGVQGWVDATLSPFFHFLRSIPSVAYYPLIVLYLGFGEAGRVILVAIPVFLLTFVSCVTATLSVSRHRRGYLDGIGASRWQVIRLLLVWETAPSAVNALRLSASLALVLVVFAELTIGGNSGLGARLRDARDTYALEDAYALVLFLGGIGWLANRGISVLESRLASLWGR